MLSELPKLCTLKVALYCRVVKLPVRAGHLLAYSVPYAEKQQAWHVHGLWCRVWP
jgi:hypothetical protein